MGALDKRLMLVRKKVQELCPEDLPELERLLALLRVEGIQIRGPHSAEINAGIQRIVLKIGGMPDVEGEETDELERALIECDKAFTANELKGFLNEYSAFGHGDKKQMCRMLWWIGCEPVVEVMAPFVGESGEDADDGFTEV